MEAQLQIGRGERDSDGDDDGEDEGEDAAGRGAGWGAGKRAYYDADAKDLEGSDDEDALRDEEEEAIRLQREAASGLLPADFGEESEEDDSDDESSDDEDGADGQRTLGDMAAATVEAVPRDLQGLDDEARAAAVRQDALELEALIGDLRSVLGEVRGRLGPLLQEVKSGELATAEGVSYLEAKHTLLVHYAASLVFYLLLKAEGRPVRDHPVIARLVEIRAYLEKIRPVDKRLHYQIEKLLAAAQRAGAANGTDGEAMGYGPRPEALLLGDDAAEEGGAGAPEDGGVYRPPRLNPVSMELEDDRAGRASAKERRRQEAAARRASRSSLVKELAAELAGAPEERDTGVPIGMDTVAALRERQRMAARDAEEEDLMIRVPLSKDERKRLRAQKRAGLSGKALLDDFADDVADLVGGDGGLGAVDPAFLKHRANQKFGADLAEQASKRGVRSGDADLPFREPLSDRRAKMDAVRARAAAAADEDGPQEFMGGEEDDFYKEAKAAAAKKKQKRSEDYRFDDLLPPAEDARVPGARKINTAIEKNRGLTPHRRKDMKNPRKKHRMKFAEANVRRKGQVQAVREGEAGAYRGEATGIKSRVSKSVKF